VPGRGVLGPCEFTPIEKCLRATEHYTESTHEQTNAAGNVDSATLHKRCDADANESKATCAQRQPKD